jgi:hypothetical protein
MKIVKTVLVVLAFTLLGAMLAPSAYASSILLTAGDFGVLAGSTVTNTGPSIIKGGGSVGVSPGSSITGFPPGLVLAPGTILGPGPVTVQAQVDLGKAYTGLAGMTVPTPIDLTGQDLGGKTLTSGVYSFSSSAFLTTGSKTLTLDAQGKANQFFVFQIGSTLTTASASVVKIINAGANDGVFWQVGSSATLGTGSSFLGNIVALSSITLTTGANILCGRALARNGAVTLDTNIISTGCADVTGVVMGESGSGGLSGGLGFGPGGGVTPTPESGTLLLLGCGILCLVALTKLG